MGDVAPCHRYRKCRYKSIYVYTLYIICIYTKRNKTLNLDEMNERRDRHDPVRYFVKINQADETIIKCQPGPSYRNWQHFLS